MAFRFEYIFLAIFLFAIEVCIALYGSGFIRHTVGDFLVVILIYCIVMGLTRLKPLFAGIGTLLLAFAIEAGQALNIVSRLGLERSTTTDIVLGSTFSWIDILAYSAGICCVLMIEKIRMSL